jgi:3-oxoacyl-[acyl-carrier-protein] synthase II
MPRVVVTGMGGVTPIGSEWKAVADNLRGMRSGVSRCDALGTIDGMRTRLAALLPEFTTPAHWSRKKTRSMGPVSLYATRATELALDMAGLLEHPSLMDGSTGISYGSTAGSQPALETYSTRIHTAKTLSGIKATDYIQLMSHTVCANLAQFFGVRGRIIPTCSACTSGSQGIGFGYESIRFGKQKVMLAGGAEEFHLVDAAVFDVMFATSTRNDDPTSTPRPFDVSRDGLVVGEGAATLVLEQLEHALARGAPIVAEVIGYGTNCDGLHVTQPDTHGMQGAMELALADAGIGPDDVDYVNMHGTATEQGDIAESQATSRLFGERMPVSSLKSYIGHTLGACGAIEAWWTIEMLREGWFAPTLNLGEVDPRCGALDYLRGGVREIDARIAMSNNFAFGGVNTSLLFKRWES